MRYNTKTLKVTRNLDEKGEKTKDFKIETEYPQFDSISEASQSAGGDDKLLAYINSAIAADSAIAPRLLGKAKGNLDKSDEDFVALVQTTRKNFSLANVERGMSQKDKVSFADQVLAISADTTIDETERARRLMELAQKARAV